MRPLFTCPINCELWKKHGDNSAPSKAEHQFGSRSIFCIPLCTTHLAFYTKYIANLGQRFRATVLNSTFLLFCRSKKQADQLPESNGEKKLPFEIYYISYTSYHHKWAKYLLTNLRTRLCTFHFFHEYFWTWKNVWDLGIPLGTFLREFIFSGYP